MKNFNIITGHEADIEAIEKMFPTPEAENRAEDERIAAEAGITLAELDAHRAAVSEVHNADMDRRIFNDPRNANLPAAEQEQIRAEYATADATTAAHVSRLLGGDGQVFDRDGVNLDRLCEALAKRGWRDGHRTGGVYRYEFGDGSAIVVAGDAWDAWDTERSGPFSWG